MDQIVHELNLSKCLVSINNPSYFHDTNDSPEVQALFLENFNPPAAFLGKQSL